MHRLLPILAGLLAVMAFSGAAHACSCARDPTADQIYASAAAIFTGTVRRVETIDPHQAVTTFLVTETFKGLGRGAVVRVHHGTSSPACGVTFEQGRTYTLAAGTHDGRLTTGQCSTWMFLPHVGLSRSLIERLRSLRDRR
jgi:hypothetical protein